MIVLMALIMTRNTTTTLSKNNDFEERSRTFQQIQSLFFNIMRIFYYGYKVFKANFTDKSYFSQ